jgi:prevent-host-death family protein
MCYIMTTSARKAGGSRTPRPRVGVRELRQNLSVYLDQVEAGTRFEVTARGRVVAMLIPVPPAASLVERLVAEGRAVPATQDHRSKVVAPPVRVSAAERRRIWEAFSSTRDDRL